MKKLVFALLLIASPSFAQTVTQSGTPTRGHVPYWVTSGVIGDGGSATDSPITTMGVTNNGGAGICVSSDRVTAAGRQQLCFGASTAGAAVISLQNYGTATAQALNFVVNGVTISLATGSGGGGTSIPTAISPFVVGDAACWSSITASLIDCGALAITAGGTGATTTSAARTNLGLGTIATQNANSVAITGGTITGLPTPINPTDATIKSYVDGLATGLVILAPSTLATAAILPNSPTYSNGASGVGATLTAGSNTTLTVDGTAAPLNTVVLVKNQASAFQNGIYTVTTAGSGAAAWVLTRASYFNQSSNMLGGSYTFITGGATLSNSSYVLAATITTVGTTAVNFNQFSQTSGVISINGVSGLIGVGTGISTSGSNLINTGVTTFNSLAGSVATNVVIQKFSATGTYTPTAGMLHAIVECLGAGGGGGSVAGTISQSFGAGGGGSGSYSIKRIVATDIVTNAAITIGAGGAGGLSGANNGNAGSDTSVVSNAVNLCIGKGGFGGQFASGAQVPFGGDGGVAGTGDVTAVGTPGGIGFYATNNTTVMASGFGGSSVFGGGALGVVVPSAATAGVAGRNYGGGGSGAMSFQVGANAAGGAGSAGLVIITEFINM